jgi:hypothetical protein
MSGVRAAHCFHAFYELLDGGPSTQAVPRTRGRDMAFVSRWRMQNALMMSRRDRLADRP